MHHKILSLWKLLAAQAFQKISWWTHQPFADRTIQSCFSYHWHNKQGVVFQLKSIDNYAYIFAVWLNHPGEISWRGMEIWSRCISTEVTTCISIPITYSGTGCFHSIPYIKHVLPCRSVLWLTSLNYLPSILSHWALARQVNSFT